MKYLFQLLLALMLVTSCVEDEPDMEVRGLQPIYLQGDLTASIIAEQPQAFGTLGKIIYADKHIYINERYKGIHVIDNTDPSAPITKHFWKVPALVDFTIRGDILYAEQDRDLLVIDVQSPEQIVLCNILEDILEDSGQNQFPTNYSGPFECVDPSKGLVSGWQEAVLTNPKCSI